MSVLLGASGGKDGNSNRFTPLESGFVSENNFDGTVLCTDFPDNLTDTVGFDSLPNTLEVLMIHDNSFSDSLI